MGRITESLIAEIEQEAATTRRVLERVPGDKLDWKPHSKSMTLGQLAFHIAGLTGGIAEAMTQASLDVSEIKPPSAGPIQDLLPQFDASVNRAKEILSMTDDASLMQEWSLIAGGTPIFTVPRLGLARTIMMNHVYHHRGQLSVYLRLLDVPVPSIYGPSADENPFAEQNSGR